MDELFVDGALYRVSEFLLEPHIISLVHNTNLKK